MIIHRHMSFPTSYKMAITSARILPSVAELTYNPGRWLRRRHRSVIIMNVMSYQSAHPSEITERMLTALPKKNTKSRITWRTSNSQSKALSAMMNYGPLSSILAIHLAAGMTQRIDIACACEPVGGRCTPKFASSPCCLGRCIADRPGIRFGVGSSLVKCKEKLTFLWPG